jgi:hypothetical protein
MKTPTAEHIDGFIMGMRHALALAEGRKRGKLSVQSHAIRTELASLTLLAEQGRIPKCKPQDGAVARQLNSPEPPTPSKGAFLAACAHYADVAAGILLVASPFVFVWGYYALTGDVIDFGGDQ